MSGLDQKSGHISEALNHPTIIIKNKHNMKKIICLAVAILACLSIDAQNQRRSVYLELAGASNGVGLSYDARFKEGSPWGYRAGLGWAYASESSLFFDSQSMRYYSSMLEVNYLLGKRKSKLEIGLGTSLGFVNRHYNEAEIINSVQTPDAWIIESVSVPKKENIFAYFFYTNIGYRHQAKSGFQWRIGISPSFTFGGKNAVDKPALYPYFSLGYAF